MKCSPALLFPSLLGVLLAGTATLACSESSKGPALQVQSAGIQLPELPAEPLYAFGPHLSHADRWAELGVIFPALFEHRQHLTGGWSFPDLAGEDEDPRSKPVWINSERAELTFHLREVGERAIRFRIVPFRAVERDGPLSFGLSLNGEELETFETDLGGITVECDLPAEHLVVGLNRLVFDLDRAWRVSEYIEGSGDLRRLSAHVFGISLTCADAEIERRRDQALELAPAAAVALSVEDSPNRDIAQVSGALLSYHLQIPPGARFSAHASLLARGPEGPERARFRLVATLAGSGESQVLLEQDVEFGAEPESLDVSLKDLGGAIARLDFEVCDPAGSNEPLLGAWLRPLLLPDPEVAAAPAGGGESAAVGDEIRERLAGAPVVMVLIDACNPNFISSYGGREDLTPHIDRLAEEGALFEQAYAHASYTISSVPAMLTSAYTWEHGAWFEQTPLAADVETWAASFDAGGYRTVGLVHSPNGSSIFGFDRGFEDFRDLYMNAPQGRRTVLAEQILPPLDEVLEADDDRPLLLWLHIVEPHEPYSPPAPWAGTLVDETSGSLEGDAATLWAIREWRLRPDEADLARIRARYEENLAYVDDVLGRVRARLETAGLFDEAIVMVFSDHGEGFLEHESVNYAGMGHGSTVYDEMSRIPLLVRLPAGLAPRGLRPEHLISNLDLLPTAADLVGIEQAPAGSRGQSFAPLLFGAEEASRDFVISHTSNRGPQERFIPTLSIRHGPWKYIHTSGAEAELYNIEADPAESINLARVPDHDSLGVMLGYLRQRLREESGFDIDAGGTLDPLAESTQLSEEVLANMRALGYVR